MSHIPVLIVVVALATAVVLRRRRRSSPGRRHHRTSTSTSTSTWRRWLEARTGAIGLVAAREIRERLRGKLFRIGTLVVLAFVAGAIVVPTIHSTKVQPQRIGVVGVVPAPVYGAMVTSAKAAGVMVRTVVEPTEAAARLGLRSGRIDLAVVAGRTLLVDKPITVTDTSATGRFALALSKALGVLHAIAAAGLSPSQAAALANSQPVALQPVQPGPSRSSTRPTSLIGVILIFVMLSQYNTWTLIGVMEEKSSRVVEVLLAAVRPLQLLSGKVIGIGLLALAQAGLVVAVALVVAALVGSDLLHGTAPLVIVATLAWLLLGYGFYSWVYAAAGSLAERQDQVQALVLPLSLPILLGYIVALTTAASGSPSLLATVLAYLPPTAPFEMPVLVGLAAVNWWEFLAAALISVASTVAVARLAAGIYRRAILRTGGRVRLRDLLGGSNANRTVP